MGHSRRNPAASPAPRGHQAKCRPGTGCQSCGAGASGANATGSTLRLKKFGECSISIRLLGSRMPFRPARRLGDRAHRKLRQAKRDAQNRRTGSRRRAGIGHVRHDTRVGYDLSGFQIDVDRSPDRGISYGTTGTIGPPRKVAAPWRRVLSNLSASSWQAGLWGSAPVRACPASAWRPQPLLHGEGRPAPLFGGRPPISARAAGGHVAAHRRRDRAAFLASLRVRAIVASVRRYASNIPTTAAHKLND